MESAFIELLKGDYKTEELQISLKSTVPIFIAHPELIIPFKSSMTDIVPFYRSEEDYFDTSRNLLLKDGPDPNKLIVLFTKVFESIVKLCNSKETSITSLPRVSLKVDIGNSPSQFEVIEPRKSDIEHFDNTKSKMFTFTGFSAANEASKLTYDQKHNLMLVDVLTRKYNNSGIGGKR